MCSRLKPKDCIIACELDEAKKKCIQKQNIKKLMNPLTNKPVIPTIAIARKILEGSNNKPIPKDWKKIMKKYKLLQDPTKLTDLPDYLIDTIAKLANNPQANLANKAFKNSLDTNPIMKMALTRVKTYRTIESEAEITNDHPYSINNFGKIIYRRDAIRTTYIAMPNATNASIQWTECDSTGDICILKIDVSLPSILVTVMSNGTMFGLRTQKLPALTYDINPKTRSVVLAYLIYFVDNIAIRFFQQYKRAKNTKLFVDLLIQ
jgi:hypothetical protein